MIRIISSRGMWLLCTLVPFAWLLGGTPPGPAGQGSLAADDAMEKIRATWERLADRAKNLQLELEGEQTLLVPKDPSRAGESEADGREPRTVPLAVRILIKFPKIYVEQKGTDFQVMGGRLFFYTYRDVRYCDGTGLWEFYEPDGPGELPQFETWPSLTCFARTQNFFFLTVGIDVLTALLCAPSYQNSDVAPLWRAELRPWDRAEPAVWEGREVYRVSESNEAFTIAFVTREPPHVCLAIEDWMRGGVDNLLSRSIFRWGTLQDWPRGLLAYEHVEPDGQSIKLGVKRLEVGTVRDEDFPTSPPRLRPGTWLCEHEEPPPGERWSCKDYLWISEDRKIPQESVPPDFLERLAIGEATLDELTGGAPWPSWPIVVGVACAVAIVASVGRWAYKRLRTPSAN